MCQSFLGLQYPNIGIILGWFISYPFLRDFIQVPIGSSRSTNPSFFACFGHPGQRSVASPIARGAKGSIRADTKIYIVRFNGGAQNDNPSISLGLACLLQFGTCKKVDIRVDKHFSPCFTTWNGGGEKNGTCAGGAATEAWSPSRFVNIFAANDKTKTSWEPGGGCTTHLWVQKVQKVQKVQRTCKEPLPPQCFDVSSLSCVSFSYIV